MVAVAVVVEAAGKYTTAMSYPTASAPPATL